MYDGRGDMVIFTNECLLASDNLLQRLLFIVLGSMEMIAQLRVASIFTFCGGVTDEVAYRELSHIIRVRLGGAFDG